MKVNFVSGDAWRASMRLPFGEYSDRVKDIEVEKAIWNRIAGERQSAEPDPYSLVIAERVCKLISSEGSIQNILELGASGDIGTERIQ